MVVQRSLAALKTILPALVASTLLPVASAHAGQTAASASLAWTKSEAILGEPSALQAILSQQEAIRPQPVQPSAYSTPRIASAVEPLERNDVGDIPNTGRPDVFGSVAIAVTRTPLDDSWQRAESAPIRGAAARYAASLSHQDVLSRLQAVNHYVNQRVEFTDDGAEFGRPDVWSAANETLRRGRGDCEDYAIAKFQMLRRAGISTRDLYLVLVKDLARRADHAVLVVRASGRMYLLDNGTDDVLETANVRDYRPMLTFASYGEWTHGYRMTSRPIYAAAAPEMALAALTERQRSRSASLLAFNTGFSK